MTKVFKDKAELLMEARALISNGAQIPDKDISEDANFKEDLGIDSLGALEIILDVEQKFGIQFDDTEQRQMSSLRNVVDLVWDKMNVVQAASNTLAPVKKATKPRKKTEKSIPEISSTTVNSNVV